METSLFAIVFLLRELEISNLCRSCAGGLEMKKEERGASWLIDFHSQVMGGIWCQDAKNLAGGKEKNNEKGVDNRSIAGVGCKM